MAETSLLIAALFATTENGAGPDVQQQLNRKRKSDAFHFLKKNETMIFVGKLVEVEIILSKLTQAKREKLWVCLS